MKSSSFEKLSLSNEGSQLIEREITSQLVSLDARAEIMARARRLMDQLILDLSVEEKHCQYRGDLKSFKETQYSLCEKC